jgi:hypothetical protein
MAVSGAAEPVKTPGAAAVPIPAAAIFASVAGKALVSVAAPAVTLEVMVVEARMLPAMAALFETAPPPVTVVLREAPVETAAAVAVAVAEGAELRPRALARVPAIWTLEFALFVFDWMTTWLPFNDAVATLLKFASAFRVLTMLDLDRGAAAF